ncbi:MAG: enoyl-CoA hydratase [Alphaproteobacteria bacterium]|nr:enoyl-CoA hydratase [Alphaproteobacteria bacterium]
MTSKLIAEIRDSAGYLILNAPDRRNALSYDMWAGIPPIIEGFAQEPKVRVVVLTGQGTSAFSAGADISEFDRNRATGESGQSYERVTEAAFDSLKRCPKPVIGAVRGICFGGGFALALACDLRLASDDARFCIPAGKLGIGYGQSLTEALVQRLGPGTAADILLTAQIYSASEALARGIVQRVTSPDRFDALLEDYIAMLSENAPLSLAAAKVAIRASVDDDDAARGEAERAAAACMRSEDYKEGRKAFAAKRKPQFQGR